MTANYKMVHPRPETLLGECKAFLLDKISHLSKSKAFADVQLNIGKIIFLRSANTSVKKKIVHGLLLLRTKSVTKKEKNICMAEI